ncbi:MAG TPA: SgcJ/EcaC family oxidoreductase [Candidatus Polarisedimenticolia bacterium]|nr:SgcJ/EcaC family oxidoreductase [Candidatus Polarisedimenticolia bacterium]
MTPPAAIIRDPLESHAVFNEAFNRGDLEALMGMYEPDAVLVIEPGRTVRGLDAIRAELRELLKGGPTMTAETVYALATGDVAVARARWRMVRPGPGGSSTVKESGSVELLRRQPDGRWLLVVDHPFGSE